MTYDQNLLSNVVNYEKENKMIIKNLLIQNIPDGILVSVEETYFAFALKNCNELNIKIPNDIKLIGYSKLSYSQIFEPSLSP